jgi:hypothetical protein
MDGYPIEEQKMSEIDLNKISTIKRVTDLFPKGFICVNPVEKPPNVANRIISESKLTKWIPNLVNPTFNEIPGNSISSGVIAHNAQMQKITQNQFQHTFIKRIRPFNFLTLILAFGWMITTLLLNFL